MFVDPPNALFGDTIPLTPGPLTLFKEGLEYPLNPTGLLGIPVAETLVLVALDKGLPKGSFGISTIKREAGGPVKGGSSYLVGERGPEMFTPGVSGMITPNHALGGSTNIVVNVDASGSNVEGDEQEGRELGKAISVAVQSELIKQKRPGGLLA